MEQIPKSHRPRQQSECASQASPDSEHGVIVGSLVGSAVGIVVGSAVGFVVVTGAVVVGTGAVGNDAVTK